MKAQVGQLELIYEIILIGTAKASVDIEVGTLLFHYLKKNLFLLAKCKLLPLFFPSDTLSLVWPSYMA